MEDEFQSCAYLFSEIFKAWPPEGSNLTNKRKQNPMKTPPPPPPRRVKSSWRAQGSQGVRDGNIVRGTDGVMAPDTCGKPWNKWGRANWADLFFFFLSSGIKADGKVPDSATNTHLAFALRRGDKKKGGGTCPEKRGKGCRPVCHKVKCGQRVTGI